MCEKRGEWREKQNIELKNRLEKGTLKKKDAKKQGKAERRTQQAKKVEKQENKTID